ncbi:MAG: DNA repair protein RecN [Gammaproteobacteria bacterium]|nr:DNA repair protein RecN [Gammaproteobacteria bacterium]
MLTQLSIRHYAIVDHLEIDFRRGMSVITGETGAGKSIMLGALGLTLGDRADKGVISSGATRADITAHFDTSDQPMARAWLQDNELLADAEPQVCLLRRVVSDDGRSKAWVNGFPVTLQVLKTIGEMLIDIHSQHEHQSLLNRSTHLRLLDEFIGDHALTEDVRRISREWKKNRERLEALSQQSEESSAQVQLIRYQIGELDELTLEAGELESLEEEYRTLNSADSSLATARQLLDLCSENDEFTVQGALNQALTLLQELGAKTHALDPVAELLNTASIQIDEAVVELRHGVDHFEANPLRLEAINQRLADIQQIARKHRVKPEELAALHARLQEQLAAWEHGDEDLETLQRQDTQLQQQYGQLAERLSARRRSAATELAQQINLQIAELGMSSARLTVALSPADSQTPAAHGQESVEFLVSTNPGQEPRPLIRIASGGELSRISLAIQVITAQTSATPTLVFDEVDVGIGGGVARAVGRLLRQLGERGQVLCVTHQAQVASQGHQHLFVSKLMQATEGRAAMIGTQIRELSREEKVREIARMLGGESDKQGLTPESLAHAEEMLSA